jgi:hypothetical protein
MENGGWRMEDGEWRMEDGGWRMENGVGSGEWERGESGGVGEWMGEWESGRVGEWESGRVGEWESGRERNIEFLAYILTECMSRGFLISFRIHSTNSRSFWLRL